ARSPGEADAAGQGRPEVVSMSLERQSVGQELLGGRVAAACHRRGGDKAERDDRRTRAESSFARDPVREREPAAVHGRKAAERAHAEVSELDVPVALGHLELVPEIERDRCAVEPGTEVGGGRGGTYAHRSAHRVASTIASGSASTATGGGLRRAAVSGSFKPWPVTTQTTRAPGSSP